MRKLFVILGFIFLVFGIVLTFFPTEQLALIPVGLSLIFGFLAFKKSDLEQKKIVKVLFILASICLLGIFAKQIFIKDEVVIDKQDEIQKVESQKEDKKDLEALEGLE